MKAATKDEPPGRRQTKREVRNFVKANKHLNDAVFQFGQGREYELLLARSFLEKADGIGSGAEAAAALERKEHRR